MCLKCRLTVYQRFFAISFILSWNICFIIFIINSYTKLTQRIEQILGVSVVGGKDAVYKGVGIAARALRIARTEGQRALVEGQKAAYKRAEDIGCEIDEIWDAALDKITRPEHGALDGQAKDLEKDGWLVPSIGIVAGPLQSGIASFDINCRCRIRGQVIGYPPQTRTYRDEKGITQIGKYQTYEQWKAKQKSISKIKKASISKPTKKQSNNIRRNYDSDLSQKIGKDHYDNMHNLIDKCENKDVIKLWGKCEDKVNVGSINNKRTAYYSSLSDSININLKHDIEASHYQSKYQVVFHESGHAIDNAISKEKYTGITRYAGYSNAYKDGLFTNTIEEEVSNLIDKYGVQIKKSIKEHITDYEWLNNKGYIRPYEYFNWKNNGKIPNKPRYKKMFAKNELKNKIRKIPLDSRGNISDIIEGATKGKIQCGIGHGGPAYWKTNKAILNGRNISLGKEAFAEMIDATLSNINNLESIKKYVPKSYKIFEQMLKEL